jgi:hypothetical protein
MKRLRWSVIAITVGASVLWVPPATPHGGSSRGNPIANPPVQLYYDGSGSLTVSVPGGEQVVVTIPRGLVIAFPNEQNRPPLQLLDGRNPVVAMSFPWGGYVSFPPSPCPGEKEPGSVVVYGTGVSVQPIANLR